MHHLDNEYDDLDEDIKSKTQIKREMHEMQEFAMNIVKLSKSQRAKLPLNDDIKDSLVLADKIKNKPEALRRHVRFMAKELLEIDLEPIRQTLDFMANKHQQETTQFHQLEQLRDELISEGSSCIEALLAECPAMERQKLRQLVRQASKEKAAEKTGKHYRELFAYIKEHKT